MHDLVVEIVPNGDVSRIISTLPSKIGDFSLNHLGLFAKFWQPGSVKTRLAKSIGDQAACQIYRCFLSHLLDRHRSTADSRCFVFSPPEKRAEIRAAVNEQWDLSPQSDGDLGDRMGSYFRAHLDPSPDRSNQGPSKVVIIGADCPLLDPTVVDNVFDLLDQVPVVIAPSKDGGYCLIAMSRQQTRIPDLFSDVNWSTPSVLAQTIDHLKRQQVEYRLLEPMNDVDEVEDLLELQSDLESRTRDFLDGQLLAHVELALSSEGKFENNVAPRTNPKTDMPNEEPN